MKNLENYGVLEMNAQEMRKIDGGFLILLWKWACESTKGEIIFHHQR